MRWFKHNELSRADFENLAGTATMENLLRNRLVVKYASKEEIARASQIGLTSCTGLYHHRLLQNNQLVHELLFEEPGDLSDVEERMTQYKMSLE